ncbi:hypothetical protein ACFE04_016908 [Oxalis oulophora]
MIVCAAKSTTQQPWKSTTPTLVLLKQCKTLDHINQIHSRLITTGFIKNTTLTTNLILSFSSSPHKPLIEFARYIFFTHHQQQASRRHEQQDPFLWNAIIKSYSHAIGNHDPKQAVVLFSSMIQNGVCIDKYTLSLVLKGCSRLGLVKEGMQIHGLLKKIEIGLDLFLCNCLIGFYVKCGCVDLARRVFDEMPDKDSVSYNSMIDGYVKCGEVVLGRRLFDSMPVWDRNLITWNSIVSGYARMEEMPERDVVTCNAMMAGYIHNGNCMDALQIFHFLKNDRNLNPDSATILVALSATARLGNIEQGMAIHHYAEENGFSLLGKIGVALIDMYSKCGSSENAMSVFEEIEPKNVDHWNAIIGGLAVHGLGDLAFHLLLEMERLSFKPDEITFIGVLNACAHSGLIKEGLVCFELMRKIHKIEPKLQHYGCMVDILARAGRIEEARQFILSMPIEPNDVIWRTLLSACQNHKNFNVGESVAEQLFTMDWSSTSSYVLLSNLYAGLGKWTEVSKVRTLMRERDLKKIPGCSWIELEGNVHEFMVQDNSHPQVAEIYSTLDEFWTPSSPVTVS